jgi:hypothetical protein
VLKNENRDDPGFYQCAPTPPLGSGCPRPLAIPSHGGGDYVLLMFWAAATPHRWGMGQSLGDFFSTLWPNAAPATQQPALAACGSPCVTGPALPRCRCPQSARVQSLNNHPSPNLRLIDYKRDSEKAVRRRLGACQFLINAVYYSCRRQSRG